MKTLLRVSLAAVALLAVAACAPEFKPPADYVGGFLWNEGRSRAVTVQEGDTLYTISRRYNVPTRAIIARNGLRAPYELRVGQKLILDPARTHTVKSGDTLSQIARLYGVEMRLIAEANDLQAPYVIQIGRTLWIPDPFQVAAAPVQGDLPPVSVEVPKGSAPRSTPIVKQDLAPPPGQASPYAAPYNPPPQTQVAAPGQQPLSQPPLSQPTSQSSPLSQTAQSPAPQPSQPATPGPSSGPVPPQAEPRELNTSPQATPESQVAELPPPAAEEPKPLSRPPPRQASRFMWPIKGKIILGFGPSVKGLHNDGINIAAAAGTQVKAADNGVVAYAGNELKGFGNLLLIKHSDGWITAYAHNDKLFVKRGDEVQQGQVISTVGRTGNVDTPQLHFEIRQGTQSVDPMAHLDPA